MYRLMQMHVILKVSKLCNLRCVYCYETPELANSERMSHRDIQKMFGHVRDFITTRGNDSEKHQLRFIWHGGEPFALPISYWREILRRQEMIFPPGKNISLLNSVQSNLTLLNKKHLPLLKRFAIGFSYDVFNDFRVNAAGQPTDHIVLKKLDWLISEGINPGGIAVISRMNIDHAREVADFFLKRGLTFRALNVYQARDMLPQIHDASVSFERYLNFFKELYGLPELREALDQGHRIDPFWTSLQAFRSWKKGTVSRLSEQQCYQKEWALMVNTNGDVFSPGDCYNPTYRYGNIFEQPFDRFLYESEGRARRILKSKERMKEICSSCFLFRNGCVGTFVSHATPEEYREFQIRKGCYIKFLAEMIKEEEEKKTTVPFPEAEKAPSDVLYLNLTYRCNSRCLFCAADVAYKKTPRELSFEDLSRLIGNKKYMQIHLSGGEPTVHPDIVRIVRTCRAHSDHVSLLTHGRSFKNKEFTEEILRAGVKTVVIPLYGADAETHDFVSKVKGSFDQTVKGFQHLQELRGKYDFAVELKLLLTRFTAPLNRSIYRFAQAHFPEGFDTLSICPLIYSQSTLDHQETFSAPFAELKEDLFSLIEEIQADGKYPLRVNEFPPCFFTTELRLFAHPNLHRPVVRHINYYGDDQSAEKLPMEANPGRFPKNQIGNGLIQNCLKCLHGEYCSQVMTPYFSSIYLQQFGEAEFHPISNVECNPPAEKSETGSGFQRSGAGMDEDEVFRRYGVWIARDFLPADLINDLQEHVRKGPKQHSRVSRQVVSDDNGSASIAPTKKGIIDEKSRKSYDVMIPEELSRPVKEKIAKIKPSIERMFGIPLSHFDGPHFLIYGTGHHFSLHRDRPAHDSNSASPRQISFSLFLTNGGHNSEADHFQGGELVVRAEKTGNRASLIFRAISGTLVVFPATLLHEIRPVASGERMSIVGWFH